MGSKKRKDEENVHIAIAQYLRLNYPDVIFTSESSGIRVPMHLAIMMKKQRSAHKHPDMLILEPKGVYHGLILEIKKDQSEVYLKNGEYSKNKHIQEQLKTLEILNSKGFYACFACGFDMAKHIIDWYMNFVDSHINQYKQKTKELK